MSSRTVVDDDDVVMCSVEVVCVMRVESVGAHVAVVSSAFGGGSVVNPTNQNVISVIVISVEVISVTGGNVDFTMGFVQSSVARVFILSKMGCHSSRRPSLPHVLKIVSANA